MTVHRQTQLMQLRGIAEQFGSGRITHDVALERLRALTTDPILLAEALATLRWAKLAVPSSREEAELVLIAAGADLRAIRQVDNIR